MMATAMYFAVSSMKIQSIKKQVKNVLDSVCTEYSIDSFDSVKQDLYYSEPMKRVEITSKAYSLLGFHDEIRVEITSKAYSLLGFHDEEQITLPDGSIMHRPNLTVTFSSGTIITANFLLESSDGFYKADLSITGGFLRKDGN